MVNRNEKQKIAMMLYATRCNQTQHNTFPKNIFSVNYNQQLLSHIY